MADYLIRRGADVDAIDGAGNSPLHHACALGNLSLARLLAAPGADVGIKDSEGRTALHMAASHGHTEIADYLLDDGAERDEMDEAGAKPLHLAVESEAVDLAELLIDRGGNVNARTAPAPRLFISLSRTTTWRWSNCSSTRAPHWMPRTRTALRYCIRQSPWATCRWSRRWLTGQTSTKGTRTG